MACPQLHAAAVQLIVGVACCDFHVTPIACSSSATADDSYWCIPLAQTYVGHDLWGREGDASLDFSACYEAKTGIGCHPKSIIRPLAVSLMDVDFTARVEEGFDRHPEAVDPEVAFVKHLRCLVNPQSHLWEQDTKVPLCDPKAKPDHSSGGLVVCPASSPASQGKAAAKSSSMYPR